MTQRSLILGKLGLLLVASCSLACESVLGGPDYRVVEPKTPAHALLQRFSSGSEECNRCLAGSPCGEAFESCAEIPSCVEFASCTLEHPSPASDTECVVRLDPSDEARNTVQAIARCYSQCVGQCGGGRNFDCVGDYRYPGTLPHSTIRVTQTLRFLLAPDKSTEGLEVSVCRPGMSCDQPITTATTDETGTYLAEFPISTAPVSEAGFRGYRLIHGQAGRLFPHRLHTSRPLMVSHDEQTGIASEELTREVLPSLGVSGSFNLVFLQIFDCRGVGAGGAFFEIDSGTVAYLHGVGEWSLAGPTVASQEGAAVALGLTPGEYHEIRALTADGKELAADTIYVPGDALVMSSLFPKELK